MSPDSPAQSAPAERDMPQEKSRFARLFGWNRASYYLMSGFALTLFLLGYVWWPLAEEYLALIDWEGQWWLYIDRLLIGVFLFMSLMIMAHADLKYDLKIIFVGLIGGLVIESWGTQTELWVYYTDERPPLWIIPAWPIASLTIDRMVRIVGRWFRAWPTSASESRLAEWPNPYKIGYWIVFPAFFVLMISFVAPTLGKSLTIAAIALVILLTISPTDYRIALLTFIAGAGLGYYLELWGTTRLTWIYYTMERPPLFAVFAHGMAAVAFWRAFLILNRVLDGFKQVRLARISDPR
jgi:hypothetical protein